MHAQRDNYHDCVADLKGAVGLLQEIMIALPI
jgi:hypothetical protein